MLVESGPEVGIVDAGVLLVFLPLRGVLSGSDGFPVLSAEPQGSDGCH